MGRQASVRIKNGRWYSEAGGVGRYFGRIDEISREKAQAMLDGGCVPTRPLTVAELRDRYLEWVGTHRSDRLLTESTRHLVRFCRAFGRLEAAAITGDHLEDFQRRLADDGHDPVYVRKHSTSVRTMFNRARLAKWLPQDFRPFSAVEGVRVEARPILEGDLPTRDEIDALLKHARGTLKDALTIYHRTGCRTSELLQARVGDFQRGGKSLVLGRHKRSKTMRAPTPRTILLDDKAFAVVERLAAGRSPDAPILPNASGDPYTAGVFDHRWARLRKRAKVRESITPYSFRHLYISELLTAGLDSLVVAKIVGTSVGMLERVYFHFTAGAFRAAIAKLEAVRQDLTG
jgi:integrase